MSERKYITTIHIARDGGAETLPAAERARLEAALKAGQARCRERLFSSAAALIKWIETAEKWSAEKNLRAFHPDFFVAADYGVMPTCYRGYPQTTWLKARRIAPRTWAVISIERGDLPRTYDAAHFFALPHGEFPAWRDKIAGFLNVGNGCRP